jgi:hypothetical protein
MAVALPAHAETDSQKCAADWLKTHGPLGTAGMAEACKVKTTPNRNFYFINPTIVGVTVTVQSAKDHLSSYSHHISGNSNWHITVPVNEDVGIFVENDFGGHCQRYYLARNHMVGAGNHDVSVTVSNDVKKFWCTYLPDDGLPDQPK